MNAEHDDRTKPRSREAKYYHRRIAQGDELLRIWANPQTLQRFRDLLGAKNEDAFRILVNHAWESMR